MNLKNFYINVYYSDEPSGNLSPEGPGWYLSATYNDRDNTVHEIAPRLRLAPDEAEKIAKVLDNFARNKPLNWTPGWVKENQTIHEGVREANEFARQALAIAVEEAEAAVQRVELLRARMAEFPNPALDTQPIPVVE